MFLAVRRVLAHEYPNYRQHLKSLDADSRHLRFGYAITDEMIDQLCDRFEANSESHILFCIENRELEFVAVGHISLVGEMELAFSVLPEYQGQGLGNQLFKRIIQWCRTHGRLNGCMVCLSTNSVVKHLCVKHGIHLRSADGETVADIQLDHPNLSTFITEATDSNIAIMDYFNKRLVHRV